MARPSTGAEICTGRILKGEKPVDLPSQRSAKIELPINLKTAKSARSHYSTFPLLGRADEVIEQQCNLLRCGVLWLQTDLPGGPNDVRSGNTSESDRGRALRVLSPAVTVRIARPAVQH